jgi:hypothetical protein
MSIHLASLLQFTAHSHFKHSPLPLISSPIQFKQTLNSIHDEEYYLMGYNTV